MNHVRNFAINASPFGYAIIGVITGAFIAKHAGPMNCGFVAPPPLTPSGDCMGLPALFGGAFWPVWLIWNCAQWWLP